MAAYVSRGSRILGARNASAGEGRQTRTEWTLYQYRICPYCNKVRALFDYLNIPYHAIEVNPLDKKEMKSLRDAEGKSSYKTVPVAVSETQEDEIVIGDSAEIYKYVASDTGMLRTEGTKKNRAQSIATNRDVEWESWVDERLAVLLFPNISRTFGESLRAFDYVHAVPSFSTTTQYKSRIVGAFAMWAFARPKVKRKHGIENERGALRDALDTFGTSALDGASFVGGNKPSFADISAFGCLRAIENMPAFDEVMAMNADVSAWYRRMQSAVGESACVSYR
eukprot:g2895.t1